MNLDVRSRFSGLHSLIGVTLWLGPLLLVAALLAWMLGGAASPAWRWVAAGALAGLGILLLSLLAGALRVLLKIESNAFRAHDAMLEIRDATSRSAERLESIAKHAPLSDLARSITSREHEREVIRRAFNETLISGDFEAAYFLADQLEQRHGYRQEADRLRNEIQAARNDARHRYVAESVERVERLLAENDWDRARAEIERLAKAYPDETAVQRLPERFRQARADHKRKLLKEWDESVQRNDIDRGIAILKALDQYLTPNEAAALEESARGVFRAKLHNLGVQFSLAVHDRQWAAALSVGQQIIAEFPNTRMAAEVGEHLEALRLRARSVETPAQV